MKPCVPALFCVVSYIYPGPFGISNLGETSVLLIFTKGLMATLTAAIPATAQDRNGLPKFHSFEPRAVSPVRHDRYLERKNHTCQRFLPPRCIDASAFLPFAPRAIPNRN